MRICLILLMSFFCLASFSAYADIYKTKDKNGHVVYTDQPAANDTKAAVVTLPAINKLPSLTEEPINTVDNTPQSIPDPQYVIDVLSPASGTRLLANERNLEVSVSVDPGLQPGHFYVYFLNGEKIQETTQEKITLVEPPRGENKLHVEVMDKYGKSFGQSESITIFVSRPIVKH